MVERCGGGALSGTESIWKTINKTTPDQLSVKKVQILNDQLLKNLNDPRARLKDLNLNVLTVLKFQLIR